MLARGGLARLVVSKTSARNLPQLARFLQRTLLSRNASSLPAVRALSRAYVSALDARRPYATTTAATKPTATVKRAVKAKAAEKAPPKKRATATSAAKTVKKPKTASKTKPQTKPKAKARKAPKKAAPRKRVKRVLTPEQEEKAKIQKEKARITQLRKAALKEPSSPRALTAYSAYIVDVTKGKNSDQKAQDKLVNASQKWKTLTPAEHEHYNHLAREMTEAKKAEYRAWVLSHTPQEINAANNARLQLRKHLKNAGKRRYPAHSAKILDDRQVKRPRSAYVLFNIERHASGDFKNISIPEASKLISEEWKALSAGEKKKYVDQQAVDIERYNSASPAVV